MPAAEQERQRGDLSPAVLQAAREGDFERYLAALLAPRRVRHDLIALTAYAGELARVPLSVREPMMGEIRLQWWRDALAAGAATDTTGHPVADALLATLRRHDLPAALLLDMIEARAMELHADAMPDEAALQAYVAGTEGAALALAARVLGMTTSPALDALVAAAAHALATTRIVTGLPQMAARGRILLPPARIAAAGAARHDILARPITPAVRRLLSSLATEARAALADARTRLGDVPHAQRTAFLPLALIEPHLRALESVNFDPPRQAGGLSPLRRVARIWWSHLTGRI